MQREKYEKLFQENYNKIKQLQTKVYELVCLRMTTKGRIIFEDFNKVINIIQEDIYLLQEDQKYYLKKVMTP